MPFPYETLIGDLSAYATLVDSNNFNVKLTIPLVERVVKNAPDIERPYGTSLKPILPLRKSFSHTARSTSTSRRGIEQTHNKVDQRILEGLGGFFERCFERKT